MLRLRTIVFLLALTPFVTSVTSLAPQKQKEEPVRLNLCELKREPKKYDRRLIEVTGFIMHGFEEFSIFDPECSSFPEVWLEYGGTKKSGTIYCCGVSGSRSRPERLVVEGIQIPLSTDKQFFQLDKILQRPGSTTVQATIVGRFFTGRRTEEGDRVTFNGFGHFGCCSLLAIQQVKSVDKQDRNDLDYGASFDEPDIHDAGCTMEYLRSWYPQNIIEHQKRAENGEREWSFDDPHRVASEGLREVWEEKIKEIGPLRETRRAPGRIVYDWRPKKNGPSFMVVVSRPYLLSFYAKDKQRIPWVLAAAYKYSCPTKRPSRSPGSRR
jgi:hypothetical protein